MVGCGSMGGGMAMLFAERGVQVSLNDPSEDTIDALLEQGRGEGFGDRLEKHTDYQDLCESLGCPKVFVFSLPHGTVGDTVVDGLQQYLTKGDIIIDASNEHWQNTQRRQGKLVPQGVYYIGKYAPAESSVVLNIIKVWAFPEDIKLQDEDLRCVLADRMRHWIQYFQCYRKLPRRTAKADLVLAKSEQVVQATTSK